MGNFTVILYDANDVTRYYSEGLCDEAKELLPLTPAATAALEPGAIRVLDPLQLHSNFGHGRDVVARSRLAAFLECRLASERGLSKSGKQTIVDYALDACGISSRIWTTLKNSDAWLIPLPEKWLRTTSRSEAHRALLARFIEPYNEIREIHNIAATPDGVWRRLLLANSRFCLKIAHSRPIFFNAFAKGVPEFIQDLRHCDPNLWTVTLTPLCADEASVRAMTACLDGFGTPETSSSRQITLTIPPRKMPEKVEIAQKVLHSVEEPVARAGIEAMLPYILGNVEWVESIIAPYRLMMSLASARAAYCWDHADRLNAAMGEAAQRAGVPSVVLSHTSISPAYDRMSLAAKGRRNRELACGSLADMALLQSPHAEAAVEQLAPHLRRRRIAPLVWGSAAKDVPTAGGKINKEKVVLHAGNYFSWPEYLPWAYETSNDYVDHLKTLVAALSGTSDIRLIIRMKSNFARKGEVSSECLQRLLPLGGQWVVQEAGSFYDDMKEADLVVAFHSATVEEALLARRPVLLLGGMSRYRHISARTTQPSPDDRAAVYAPDALEDLPGLIASILESHTGRPLTDLELAGHVWPPEIMSVRQLAAAMIDNSVFDAKRQSKAKWPM